MMKHSLAGAGLLLVASCIQAQTTPTEVTIPPEELDACLRSSIIGAADSMSVRELKEACSLLLEKKIAAQVTEEVVQPENAPYAINGGTENQATRERMTIEALN